MEASGTACEHLDCRVETLNFISDLVELVGHYEEVVVTNLQSRNDAMEVEIQDLRLRLEEAISTGQAVEARTAEAIFLAMTSMIKELSLQEEKNIELDVPNQDLSSSLHAMIADKVSAYKLQLAEDAKAMREKFESVSSKNRALEQRIAEVTATLRAIGEELVSSVTHSSSQASELSSSTANLTFFMDDGAALSTVLADLAGAVKVVSEHNAQTCARLLQAESELLFYKTQAQTRADSEQKALESLSNQVAEGEKLKRETSDALNLISDLQMGLYAKNSEISELQKELKSLSDMLKVEEVKTADLNRELLSTQKVLAETRSNLLTEQARVSAMSGASLQLEQAQKDLRTAELTIAKLKTEHQDMEQAMVLQTDTIKQLNATLHDTLEDKSRLDAKLCEDATTRQNATQELYRRLDELSLQNAELHARVVSLEQELGETTERLSKALKAAEAQAEKAISENKAASSRILKLEETEQILTENLKDCELELARVHEANIALQTDIVEISQEKEQVKEQSSANERLVHERLEQTEQIMSEMAAEMDSLKQQIENLTTDIHIREEMIANCEEEIGRLDALHAATTEELQRINHQKESLEDELAQKDLQLEKANFSLVSATSDMQTALKSAEDAFTDRYLKALEDLKVARAGSVELEERLANLRSELQSAHLRLDEKNAELEALLLQNDATLKDKLAIIEELQANLAQRDGSVEALSSQNDCLLGTVQELNTRVRGLEDELEVTTRRTAEQEDQLQRLLINGSDLQKDQLAEQTALLSQQDARISTLRSDLSNIEQRLFELVDAANRIFELLTELAENSNQSMVELSKVGSRSVSRAASVAESLALSTLSTAKSVGPARLLVETTLQQKDSEAALAIERMTRLEATMTSIRESVVGIITLTKQRLEEVVALQERISVKEKEVNLLLDLTKSREDRINVLLEEINNKGVTISEQAEVIDKMMKDLEALRGVL
ncbi:Chromosome segregation protein SMC [Giardia duodenalis]|uniref:Chromosome segregation protein SMC n=1 Tax=Giardia intestinalis TaxID=5741 RepID=V6TF71_GIAIN|nr:Chromosome segregation protein SMC [Giardia intestinalis]